jgi:ribose-phosphate pyrophosphokinase
MIEQPSSKTMMLFAGSSNRGLSEAVAKKLGTELLPIESKKFASGEIYIRLNESARGGDCFVLQSHSGDLNSTIMEQILIIDALKRASAKRITAVLPFYPYSRQDKKALPREPISARVVGDMFVNAGADRLVSIDLHTQQIQGFIEKPFDHLTAMPLFAEHYKDKFKEPVTVVSPDAGGVKRATVLAKRLEAYVAFIHKKRDPRIHNEAEALTVIGEVEGRHAVLIDDIIDTAGTIAGASHVLKDRGALSVSVVATHGIFSGPSVDRLKGTPIEEILVTDTVATNENTEKIGNVKVVSVASIIGEALGSIFSDDSVSEIFMGENVV